MSPARRLLGLATFAAVACLSYAGQRLYAALNEAPPLSVLLQAHTPYYWRMALAVLHGGSAGLLVAWGVREEAARRGSELAPVLVVISAVLSAIVLGLRP